MTLFGNHYVHDFPEHVVETLHVNESTELWYQYGASWNKNGYIQLTTMHLVIDLSLCSRKSISKKIESNISVSLKDYIIPVPQKEMTLSKLKVQAHNYPQQTEDLPVVPIRKTSGVRITCDHV